METLDNSNLEKRERKIKSILNQIETKLGCNGLIYLIFNPLVGGGEIISEDSKNINAFIQGLKIQQATILLHGPGGNFNEAMLITKCIRNRFSTYRTFVPQLCCSSLCFLALKSDKLILLKGGSLTQYDPQFKYNGKWIRAIKHLNDKNDKTLKTKSKEIYHYAENKIFELITDKPSLLDSKKVDFDNIHRENIIEAMMNKAEHIDAVDKIAFEFLPFKVDFNGDYETSILSNNLIIEVQNYLIDTGRRYSIGCTYETKIINKSQKGKTLKGNLLFSP
jgi:hypothetical protein